MKTVKAKTVKPVVPVTPRLGAVGIRRVRPGPNAAINAATELVCQQREAEIAEVAVKCPMSKADWTVAKNRDVTNKTLRALGIPARVALRDTTGCDSETARGMCGSTPGISTRYALVPCCTGCGANSAQVLRVVDECQPRSSGPGCGAFTAQYRCTQCGQHWAFGLGYGFCGSVAGFFGHIPTPDEARALEASFPPAAVNPAVWLLEASAQTAAPHPDAHRPVGFGDAHQNGSAGGAPGHWVL